MCPLLAMAVRVSIDRLSPSASMLELVRALSKRPDRATRTSAKDVSGKNAAQPKEDLTVLRGRLAELARNVDPEDEQALIKARRPLFQEIVLWEFGGDFRQHPEFGPMLDTIERAFDADPHASDRFGRLIRALRR